MQIPLEKIAEKLNHALVVELAYYFGSFAEGKALAKSDLDLAVLCKWDALPSKEKLWDLRTELAELCGRDVDLVLLNEAGPVLAMQVITKGKLFIENVPKRHAWYAMRIFSQYAEFKEMIKPMEDNILQRRLYG